VLECKESQQQPPEEVWRTCGPDFEGRTIQLSLSFSLQSTGHKKSFRLGRNQVGSCGRLGVET
jgi:hypothetical protein